MIDKELSIDNLETNAKQSMFQITRRRQRKGGEWVHIELIGIPATIDMFELHYKKLPSFSASYMQEPDK